MTIQDYKKVAKPLFQADKATLFTGDASRVVVYTNQLDNLAEEIEFKYDLAQQGVKVHSVRPTSEWHHEGVTSYVAPTFRGLNFMANVMALYGERCSKMVLSILEMYEGRDIAFKEVTGIPDGILSSEEGVPGVFSGPRSLREKILMGSVLPGQFYSSRAWTPEQWTSIMGALRDFVQANPYLAREPDATTDVSLSEPE